MGSSFIAEFEAYVPQIYGRISLKNVEDPSTTINGGCYRTMLYNVIIQETIILTFQQNGIWNTIVGVISKFFT